MRRGGEARHFLMESAGQPGLMLSGRVGHLAQAMVDRDLLDPESYQLGMTLPGHQWAAGLPVLAGQSEQMLTSTSSGSRSQLDSESYLLGGTSPDHQWAAPWQPAAEGWPDQENHLAGGTSTLPDHQAAPQTVW